MLKIQNISVIFWSCCGWYNCKDIISLRQSTTIINNLIYQVSKIKYIAFNRVSAWSRLHDRLMKKINKITSAGSGGMKQWACCLTMMRKINYIHGNLNTKLTVFNWREFRKSSCCFSQLNWKSFSQLWSLISVYS